MINRCNIRFLILLFFSFPHAAATGQKLSFQNYGVDKGLIQSQVLCITQDLQRHLWIGTMSGLDRFDGTDFKHYTKSDGINSTIPTCLLTASNGKIWIGTFMGIAAFDGVKFFNYAVEGVPENPFFSSILEDSEHNIYARSQKYGLYHLQNGKFIKNNILPGKNPTCVIKNSKAELLAIFDNAEVFTKKNGHWKPYYKINGLETNEVLLAATVRDGTMYFISNNGFLLKTRETQITARQKIHAAAIASIGADNDGNIWVGTQRGIHVFDAENLSPKAVYNASNGLSDNTVTYIYKDREGNMWMATDGDGLFMLPGQMFSRYDKNTGLAGNVVMGFAKDNRNNLYIGTKEGGLTRFNNHDKKLSVISYSHITKAGINCIERDAKGNIYIGTLDNRLLKYDGRKFEEIMLDTKQKPFINSVTEAYNSLWITGSSGCHYIQNGTVKKIAGLSEVTVALLPLADSSLLISGMKGAYQYQLNGRLIKIDLLQNTEVLCFYRLKQHILVGTLNEGILFWDMKNGTIDTCDIKDGLSDNMVFSLYEDTKNNLWAGTGAGLQQISYNSNTKKFAVRRFTHADGYERVENSMNCITEDSTGHIWIGTTKGAFRLNPYASATGNTAPYVVIKSASSENTNTDPSFKNTLSPPRIIPFVDNNINFTVKGIFFKDPNSITYAFQLAGVDTGFSAPTSQDAISYKKLEPGNYTFRVKAFNGYGRPSDNIAEYEFIIATPFYKSGWFKTGTILLLILTGFALQFLITKWKQQKARKTDLFRLKEQDAIRQKTSEDFHDELGNKLTRISLLTDILKKKLREDDASKENILGQIQENVAALYSGTKDIIWSLSPQSNNLVEILKYIQHFGHELLNDTPVEFSVSGIGDIDERIGLPIDYSRNLVMIFKELLTNALRHSAANKVSLQVKMLDPLSVQIALYDNGKGFNTDTVKKGNGLSNISRRAEKIKADLKIETVINAGTNISVTIKTPPKGGYYS